MKISLNVFWFKVRFNTPFNTGKSVIEERDALLLIISDEKDNSGISEISILPGYTGDNRRSIENQLEKIVKILEKNHLPDEIKKFPIFTKGVYRDLNISPQLCFAIDSALMNLYEKRMSEQGFRLFGFSQLGNNRKPLVNVNGLIIPESPIKKSVKSIEKYVSEGFKTFKIKLGRIDRKDEKELLIILQREFGSTISIRTDSNMKMDFNEAVDFFSGVDPEIIDYAEDPFPELGKIPEFFDLTGIKTGIDIVNGIIDIPGGGSNSGIGAIVLKPPLVGGIEAIKDIFNICKSSDIQLVFSSLFETGVGILNLAKISLVFNINNCAMGFDTLKFIENDPLGSDDLIKNGKIYPYEYDYEKLWNSCLSRRG